MSETEFLHIVAGIVEHMQADHNFAQRYNHVDIHVIGGEPSMLGVPFYESALPKAKALLALIPQAVSFSIVTNLVTKRRSMSLGCSTRFRHPMSGRPGSRSVGRKRSGETT